MVRFTCANQEPMIIENLPFDKYEVEPCPLTQYILSRKQASTCWQVCVSCARACITWSLYGSAHLTSSNHAPCAAYLVIYNFTPSLIIEVIDFWSEFSIDFLVISRILLSWWYHFRCSSQTAIKEQNLVTRSATWKPAPTCSRSICSSCLTIIQLSCRFSTSCFASTDWDRPPNGGGNSLITCEQCRRITPL